MVSMVLSGTLIFVSVTVLVSGLLESGLQCRGRCFHGFDSSMGCQCNGGCVSHGDCCSDYHSICDVKVSPTIADKLWQIDPDKFTTSDIRLNKGGHIQASGTTSTDLSPNKLFSYVNPAKMNYPIYKALMELWDNYSPVRGQGDNLSTSDRKEINHFLDLVMNSPVMDETLDYLTEKHLLSGGKTALRSKLYSMWFEPYSRTGSSPPDSSGFEHVFVGEYKSSKVEGLHSWVRLYKEEMAGHLNYLGYFKQDGPILEMSYTWNGHLKKIGTSILGSSPVFDLALGTICMLTRPNSACSFTLGGRQFSLKVYDDAHTPGLQIGTAFVEI